MPFLPRYREWSALPSKLLDEIMIKFSRFTDCMRFGEVCKHWNHAYLESTVHLKQDFRILKVSRSKLPMLIFKTNQHSNETRGLFSVTKGITYNVQLPIPDKFGFFGSSHGWLFITDYIGRMKLVDPFNNGSISLPLLGDTNYWSKGLLSSDPHLNPDNYEVVVLCRPHSNRNRLVYYKSGETSWKFIRHVEFHISDVIFYKNNLYAVSIGCGLMKINFDGKHEKVVTTLESDMQSNRTHFVKSLYGDLLLVTISCVCTENKTSEIKVFKLSSPDHNGLGKWVMVDNIGEQALFVDDMLSVSVSISKFPNPYTVSNSVHYIEKRKFHRPPYSCANLYDKYCVFSLSDKSFIYRDFLHPDQKHDLNFFPNWFVPTLRDIEKQVI